MIDVNIEKVMNRQKVADSIHSILDAGIELLNKETFDPKDHTRIKVMRTLGTHVNGAVAMIQQETAQLRAKIVSERLKQLGYDDPKQVS